jgi:hypothetical protein
MRTVISLLLLLLAVACAGDAPGAGSGRTCGGLLYDRCLSEHDCMAMNPDCRSFQADGIQVCSKPCTVGDDASCGMTLDGRSATCNQMGVCKPAGANDCTVP